METKMVEIRDRATMIVAMATRLGAINVVRANEQETYLCWRAGYTDFLNPAVILTRLTGNVDSEADPESWYESSSARTMPIAHKWIAEHFNEIQSGDVVDVEFILGETKVKKISEKFTANF